LLGHLVVLDQILGHGAKSWETKVWTHLVDFEKCLEPSSGMLRTQKIYIYMYQKNRQTKQTQNQHKNKKIKPKPKQCVAKRDAQMKTEGFHNSTRWRS
jgi:hypothetical protein